MKSKKLAKKAWRSNIILKLFYKPKSYSFLILGCLFLQLVGNREPIATLSLHAPQTAPALQQTFSSGQSYQNPDNILPKTPSLQESYRAIAPHIHETSIQIKKGSNIAGELRFTHNRQSLIGHIQYLRVEQHARKQGLGSMLMLHALGKLQTLGCSTITLNARPLDTNPEEINYLAEKLVIFYQQFGFQLDASFNCCDQSNHRMTKLINEQNKITDIN